MKHNLLLIDDDQNFRLSMKAFLANEGFQVFAVNYDEGRALVRQGIVPFSLALVDYHMPLVKGDEAIAELKRLDESLTVLALSGDDSIEVHNQTLHSGASFVVSKVTEDAKLLGIIHRICRDVEKTVHAPKLIASGQNEALIEKLGMVGCSQKLAEVAQLILKCAPFQQSVLILGENGTGKEKVAQAIHQHSPRRNRPFIAINCGAFSKDLIASELFGHHRGAFTGALESRIGKFQAAEGGTIFLDEIGEMPLELQAMLLRVLQERQITPLGSTEPRPVDVRVVAATNAPLIELIEDGRFREDLYYRLSGFPILLSPLRERPEDIAPLAKLFLASANSELGTEKVLTEAAVEELSGWPWPGNVRELQNTIIRLATMVDGNWIRPTELRLVRPEASRISRAPGETLGLVRARAAANERHMIEDAVAKSTSVSAAARLLGLSRSTFRDKLKKYGINLNERSEI